MTTRERAEKLAIELLANAEGLSPLQLILVGVNNEDLGGLGLMSLTRRIEQAVAGAIEEEREECAKECDAIGAKCDSEGNQRQGEIAKICARSIRAGRTLDDLFDYRTCNSCPLRRL